MHKAKMTKVAERADVLRLKIATHEEGIFVRPITNPEAFTPNKPLLCAERISKAGGEIGHLKMIKQRVLNHAPDTWSRPQLRLPHCLSLTTIASEIELKRSAIARCASRAFGWTAM